MLSTIIGIVVLVVWLSVLGWLIVRGLRTGDMSASGVTITRQRTPIQFWFRVVLMMVVFVFVLVFSVRALFVEFAG